MKHHVIAVNETCLNPAFTDEMAQIPGYTLIRNDRQERSSGGIALYTRENIKYRIIEMSQDTGLMKLPEFLICEISFANSLIMVIYRPPNSPFHRGIANYSNNNSW